MRGFLGNQKGTTLVIAAVTLSALLGIVALVSDIGLAYLEKQKLDNAVDAAALAAVQALKDGQDAARAVAEEYITANGFSTDSMTVSFPADGKSVEVSDNSSVNFYFARALGISSTSIGSYAKALMAPLSGVKGARPLAVEKFDFQYGVGYTLKVGTGDEYSGNYGAVALGGTGASIYKDNIEFSYDGMLRVNQWIQSETGNMAGPTKTGIDYLLHQCPHVPRCDISHFDPTCPMVITVPIVNTLQVNGRGEIQIVGFAQFLLKGIEDKGGHADVTGWFIKNTVVGENDPNAQDFGVYSIKLIK